MRMIALAAVVGVGLTVGGVALARPWSDPNGRINFDAPSGWVMEVRRSSPQTIVLAGSANDECYLLATPNAVSANSSPDAVRRTTDPLAQDAWVNAANSVSPMFPGRSAAFIAQSVDTTTGFWPIQRAEFGGAERPVYAALTSRPGIDLMAFCWSYSGSTASAFERVFASISHPQDAQWQAAADAQVADRAARAAAAAAGETTPPTPEN